MSWICVGEFPLEKDLAQLNALLNRDKVPHRFTEEAGVQRLWLAGEEHIPNLKTCLDEYSQIDSREAAQKLESSQSSLGLHSTVQKIAGQFRQHPITMMLILLGLFGFLSVEYHIAPVLKLFYFYEYEIVIEQGQIWRILTPAFLHFGVMHLIFNTIMIWFVGWRLERFLGKINYFLLFLFTAVLGNLAHVYFSGPGLFGGLSGVVYGYIACVFILARKWPDPVLKVPEGLFIFLLVSLVVGFSGFIDIFINGMVANWAHLGGLVGGLLFGLIVNLFGSKRSNI